MNARSEIDDVLRALCSGNIEPAQASTLRQSPDFHLACALANLETVLLLLGKDSGWARRRGGPYGWTPIEYACYSRWSLYHPQSKRTQFEIVKLLLELGGDPNACHLLPENGPWPQTVLYASSGILNHVELTGLLLEAGADVNEGLPEPDPKNPRKSPWGPEALYHASEFRDTACLELLLKAKPRPLYVSYCLARALDFENPAAVDLFLRHGADPDYQVPWAHDRTHLQRAIVNGLSTEIVELLVKAGANLAKRDSHGFTAYRYAVRYGRLGVQRLLEGYGEFDATAADCEFGLLMQGIPGAMPSELFDRALFNDAARRNDLKALMALAGTAADLNMLHEGMAPLHEAAWWGSFDSVRFLVDRGADLHLSNSYGGDAVSTAIHGSMHCMAGGNGSVVPLTEEAPEADYAGIVEFLIEAGAKAPDRCDGSPAVQKVLRRYFAGLKSAE